MTIKIMNIVFVFIMLFIPAASFCEDGQVATEKILAVVPVHGSTVDQSVYKRFDKLVPELRRIAKNRIIKLECRYTGRPERAVDVENAYKLAGRIEKYFRDRHKLELDLWVSVDMNTKSAKNSHVLTLAVFSDEIKKLGTVVVDPQKKDTQ